MKIDVVVASEKHLQYVSVINNTIDEAAKARGTGIAGEPTSTSPIKSSREKRLLLLTGKSLWVFVTSNPGGMKNLSLIQD